jgi:ADP-ribose pyrophosphatase YjhB (NUDIX family)
VTDTADLPPEPLEPHRPAGWLSAEGIAAVRRQMPLLYVDAVPVRVDDSGDVVAVGLLLRVTPEGVMSRALVSGRVMYHERVRDALLRHIEKDLGSMALPQVPPSPQPFTVAEYFPTPGVTPYHDPRQHAVSLAYVVPVTGDCRPQQDSLDLAWLTPEEVCSEQVQVEMNGGQGLLLRQAMAHVGRMP